MKKICEYMKKRSALAICALLVVALLGVEFLPSSSTTTASYLIEDTQMAPLAKEPSSPLRDVIAEKLKTQDKVKLDLFVMSQCPFGVRAEQALASILEEFGDKIEFTLYFIASEDGNGSFLSLHGQAEVDEDIRQVVIAKYYPDRFLGYLLARSADYTSANWQQYADGLGIDAAKVSEIANSEEGKDLLRANIRLGNELNIDASPTLFVDDAEYTGAIFTAQDATDSGITTPSTEALGSEWRLRCRGYEVVTPSGRTIIDCWNDLKVERCTSSTKYDLYPWACVESSVTAYCVPFRPKPYDCAVFGLYCKQVTWKFIKCVQCLGDEHCPPDITYCMNGNVVTEDWYCNTSNQCEKRTIIKGCDDGNPCTQDSCENVSCVHRNCPPCTVCTDIGCSSIGGCSIPSPAPSSASIVEPISPAGSIVTFDNETVQVVFPAEAVFSPVSVVYLPQAKTGINGFKVVRLFSLEAYTGDCTWQKFTDFNKPVSIQVSYLPEEVAGIDRRALRLYYFNNALNQWVVLPSAIDPATDSVTVNELNYFTLHFTLFALMAPADGAAR